MHKCICAQTVHALCTRVFGVVFGAIVFENRAVKITARGLPVTIAEQPGSALIVYRKVAPKAGDAGK